MRPGGTAWQEESCGQDRTPARALSYKHSSDRGWVFVELKRDKIGFRNRSIGDLQQKISS